MKAYSLDLRERILRAVDGGMAQVAAARVFDVSRATVHRYVRQRRTTGSVAPQVAPGAPPRIGPAQHDALRTQLAAAPDATLAQHCATWEQTHGVRVSVATMARAIARLGWTRKKSPSSRANATKRPAPGGGPRSPRSTRPGSSSWTRRGATGR